MGLDFVIGGAQRSGTTTLWHLLNEHPDLALARPIRPEPRFFLKANGPRELNGLVAGAFTAADAGKVLGEKSTTYLETTGLTEKMHRLRPELKLIFILREPIARAVSNYKFSWDNGFESIPFEEAVRREEERLATTSFPQVSGHPFAYLLRSRYVEHLTPYLETFGRERVHVELFEEVVADRPAAARRLYEFLGVAEGFAPPSLKAGAYNRGPDLTVDLDRATLDFLTGYFRPFNERLAKFLGRDLAVWDRRSGS